MDQLFIYTFVFVHYLDQTNLWQRV